MPVDADLQQKVITLVGMNGINAALKVAIRERFYQLKLDELGLEKTEVQFKAQQEKSKKELESEIQRYSTELDNILKQKRAPKVVSAPIVPEVVDNEQMIDSDSTEEYVDESELITPQKATSAGVKVRMQEAVEDTSDGLTDDEVPIELSDDNA